MIDAPPLVGQPGPAVVAQAFAGPVFRALAAPYWSPDLRRLQPLVKLSAGSPDDSVAEAFERGHAVMRASYRGEYFYKNQVISRIIFGRHSTNTASAHLELQAGSSIADVVVFNGTSTAYEIKTDRDNFERLETQIRDYSQSFARTYVVTSIERASIAARYVPEHIGLLGLRRNGSLSELRQAAEDVGRLSVRCLSSLLRQKELLRVLERTLQYELDTTPAKLRNRTVELFATLPIDVAHAEVVRELRGRGCEQASVASVVPASLRALAFAVPLSNRAAQRMTETLARPVREVAEG